MAGRLGGYIIEVPIFGKNNFVLSLPLMRRGAAFEVHPLKFGKQMDSDRAWSPNQQSEGYLWDKVNILEQNKGFYFLQCPMEHKNLDTGEPSLKKPTQPNPTFTCNPSRAKVSVGYTK